MDKNYPHAQLENHKDAPTHRQHGATLVEVVVGILIGSAVILGISGIGKIFNQGKVAASASEDSFQNLVSFMQALRSDLVGANDPLKPVAVSGNGTHVSDTITIKKNEFLGSTKTLQTSTITYTVLGIAEPCSKSLTGGGNSCLKIERSKGGKKTYFEGLRQSQWCIQPAAGTCAVSDCPCFVHNAAIPPPFPDKRFVLQVAKLGSTHNGVEHLITLRSIVDLENVPSDSTRSSKSLFLISEPRDLRQ